jgi:hypothetical protein
LPLADALAFACSTVSIEYLRPTQSLLACATYVSGSLEVPPSDKPRREKLGEGEHANQVRPLKHACVHETRRKPNHGSQSEIVDKNKHEHRDDETFLVAPSL